MAVESIDDQVSRLRAMSGCQLLCNGVRYANSSLLACLSDAGQTTKIITRSRWNNE
jgi:hypothetical protein